MGLAPAQRAGTEAGTAPAVSTRRARWIPALRFPRTETEARPLPGQEGEGVEGKRGI